MAEEPKEEESKEPEKKKKKGGFKTILMMLVGLFLGAALASVGLYFGGFFQPLSAADDEKIQQAAEAAVKSAIEESGILRPTAPADKVNQVVELDPFIVNLEGNASADYIRVGMALGFEAPDPAVPVVEPTILLPRVKDYILMYLSRRHLDDMMGVENKAQIKLEIKEAVAAMIPPEKGALVEVYLTEFLIQ